MLKGKGRRSQPQNNPLQERFEFTSSDTLSTQVRGHEVCAWGDNTTGQLGLPNRGPPLLWPHTIRFSSHPTPIHRWMVLSCWWRVFASGPRFQLDGVYAGVPDGLNAPWAQGHLHCSVLPRLLLFSSHRHGRGFRLGMRPWAGPPDFGGGGG